MKPRWTTAGKRLSADVLNLVANKMANITVNWTTVFLVLDVVCSLLAMIIAGILPLIAAFNVNPFS
jgi:hypothetical protein